MFRPEELSRKLDDELEFGVRLALGAERADIRRLVFGEAGKLLPVGLLLRLAGSFALSRYAESLLFGLDLERFRKLFVFNNRDLLPAPRLAPRTFCERGSVPFLPAPAFRRVH